MKKMFLFICTLLIVTVSLAATPVMVRAEDSEGRAEESDFVGNYTCGRDPGDTKVIRFHESLPDFTSNLYDLLKILTPVIIIITGMLDIVKSVTAQKEDDLKKAQKKLLNRIIIGAVVFLVYVIVEFVITFVADTDAGKAWDCVDCFLKGSSHCDNIGVSYQGGNYDHEKEACFYCNHTGKYTWGNADTLGRRCTAHEGATSKDSCEALN